MLNPTTNRGAGPCFEGPTQRGAYFSGNGAHVILSECNLIITTSIRNRLPVSVQLIFDSLSLKKCWNWGELKMSFKVPTVHVVLQLLNIHSTNKVQKDSVYIPAYSASLSSTE